MKVYRLDYKWRGRWRVAGHADGMMCFFSTRKVAELHAQEWGEDYAVRVVVMEVNP